MSTDQVATLPLAEGAMSLPADLSLPLFVYGALKPGLPAYEPLRDYVEATRPTVIAGQLWVRDGLPLLRPEEDGEVCGCLIVWKKGFEIEGYGRVCLFEPQKHYQWHLVTLGDGTRANALAARFPKKGNPVFWNSNTWRLCDDPAFGPALDEIDLVLREVETLPPSGDGLDWKRFFRAQMAYLLLWSVLERLAALCFGPAADPMQRIKRLHELDGVPQAVLKHVTRTGEKVADSRNPKTAIKLDPENAEACFKYYYQLRSNLSHRGKAVFDDFDKVHMSLRELLAITQEYLSGLKSREKSST